MLQKLKTKWGIKTPFQFIIVIVVFGVTGSAAALISDPITAYFNLDELPGIFYWPIRLIVVFPVYQILLILFGFLFGILISILTLKRDEFVFNFFFNMSILFTKKLINFLSFGVFFKN